MAERFSIVVTVRNEERNLPPLLDSLAVQEAPFEVVLVDAHSTDRTREIARTYAERFDFLRTYEWGGTRGEGRNYGVQRSDAPHIAFTDGDCIASPFWLRNLRRAAETADVAAGRTILMGYRPFEDLERVALYYGGYDITYPSCNLAYPRELFLSLGGFDEWFLTAEDIDLNLRAVSAGAKFAYAPEAIVYTRTRASWYDFVRQAFWNGAGRKQLTLKHGTLWSSYRPGALFRTQATPSAMIRLGAALTGYAAYKTFGRRRQKRL